MKTLGTTHGGGCRYQLERSELKNRGASEFNNGDIIQCGKYFIWIWYKRGDQQYDNPHMLSRVNTKDSFNDLSLYSLPYYIYDFLMR